MRRYLRLSAALAALAAVMTLPAAGTGAQGSETALGDLPGAGAPGVPELANLTRPGANLVRLLAGAFDPLAEAAPAPLAPVSEATLAAGTPQYWLVQVRDERFADVAAAAAAASARIVGHVPDDTYMVRATPAQRAELAANPAVRWSGYYQPGWRVPQRVLDAPGRQAYRVYAFRDDPDPSAVGRALAGLAGVRVLTDQGAVYEIEASAAQLPLIAAIPAVEWVDLTSTEQVLNANARWVTDTGVRDLFAATARLTGAGQTAAVADTAVNYTTDLNGRAHAAFRDCPGGACKLADYTQTTPGITRAQMFGVTANGTSHRKMAAFFDLGNTGPNPFDDSAHGSHVAGSVTGDLGANGTAEGHDGMAPGARLVHQNIGTSGGGLTLPATLTAPENLYWLFQQAYRPRNPGSVPATSPAAGNVADYADYVATEDARTHNNSWSSAITGGLPNSGYSVAVDKFVWDHEDMVIVYSAGNGGPNTNTFSSPSNAKNDISSGASANGRQPMVSIDSMASFSSHGPTQDGRMGPDVATPGQIVVSTKGGTTSAYHVLQGTSMSGPVLTGLATLVRQYFWDGYAAAGGDGFAGGAPAANRRHNPSAALVKATLINGAVRMRGWYTGTDGRLRDQDGQWPSAGQGYGRVSLDNSLYFSDDPLNAWYQDVWRGDAQAFTVAGGAQTRTYQLAVQAGKPLDVTLAWTDAPDLLPHGTPALVNNLDLTVTAPDGTVYVGNNMNSRLTPGVAVAETLAGPAPADTREVTERVRVANPAAGTWTITVRAAPIAIGNQGFALAASGLLAPAGAGFTAGPSLQADRPGAPSIGDVRIEPVSADTAVVRFSTSEPTTATAIAGGNVYVDSYNAGNDAPNVGPGPGLRGLNEGQVETSDEYANRPVVGTSHEILLTGLVGGRTYAIGLTATDLAGHESGQTLPYTSLTQVFQADAPDIGGLAAGGGTAGWRVGTQLYAGATPTLTSLGAFMFRLPESVDPDAIVGAAVELTSHHDVVSHYTQDPLFTVDLLPASFEPGWGTQTYEQIRPAASAARAYPEVSHRRGNGVTYAFSFRCTDLEALKATLRDATGGQRRAAFRFDSTGAGLFSMDFGFNRRSLGPDRRPRLVLFTEANRNPYGLACDPATPAPAISEVGVKQGVVAGSYTISWETDVRSDSLVLLREQGTSEWLQIGAPSLTKVHNVQVFGLDPTRRYEFAVRSAACNGATTTDTNGGAGYTFYTRVESRSFWFGGQPTDQANKLAGTPTATFGETAPIGEPPITQLGVFSGTGTSGADIPENETGAYWNGTLPEPLPAGKRLDFDWFFSSRFGQVFATTADLTIFAGTPFVKRHQERISLGVLSLTSPNPVRNRHSITLQNALSGRISIQLTTPFVNNDFVAHYGAVSAPSGFGYPIAEAPAGAPRTGPIPAPSAGATGLNPPPTRTGPASAADRAAGTATCSIPAPAQPDLVVTAISTSQNTGTGGAGSQPREGEKVTVRATIANLGTAAASASTTRISLDGTLLGTAATPALAPGAVAQVSVVWDTRGVKGDHVLQAVADATGAVEESNEDNNAATLAVTVRGNKVQNGSFEQSNASGSGPADWSGQSTGAGSTGWSDGGSDGSKSASVSGNGGSATVFGVPTWTSAPVAVTPGETLDVVASVRSAELSSAPTIGLAYLGTAGQLLETVSVLTAPLSTTGFQTLERTVTVPAGIAQVRVVLSGFSPLDTATRGTVTFDEVGIFAR